MNKKQFTIIFMTGVLTICGISSCASNAPQTTQSANNSAPPQNATNSLVASSHSAQNLNTSAPGPSNSVPKSETKTKWTQSGEPIDVSTFNADIAKAEKDLKAKPKDETAKKALAAAYLNRAVALTDARQYASALGDYRRALKYDAANEEAKSWIDQITNIYQTMNREGPKEGEEPPPMPFNK